MGSYNDCAFWNLPARQRKLRMAAPRGPNDRSSGDEPPQDGGPEEAAGFIAEQVVDLARLARRHGHDTLGLLLDMAVMEAQEIAGPHKK
jgi:hypothetical protein